MVDSSWSGPIVSIQKQTDGGLFIPANVGSFYTGTWTDTRVAAGDYCMRKTAAAQSGQAAFYVGAYVLQKIGADPHVGTTQPGGGRSQDIRGYQISAIDVIYQVTGAALVTHTYDLHTTTYANNAAASVDSTVGGTLTGALATATQTNPYVTQISLGTAYVVGANTALRDVVLEIAWDAAASSVLSYYGIYLRLNYNLT